MRLRHVATCRTPPGEGGGSKAQGEGDHPPLERKRKLEREGRSAAKVCTSEARKTGDTPCAARGAVPTSSFRRPYVGAGGVPGEFCISGNHQRSWYERSPEWREGNVCPCVDFIEDFDFTSAAVRQTSWDQKSKPTQGTSCGSAPNGVGQRSRVPIRSMGFDTPSFGGSSPPPIATSRQRFQRQTLLRPVRTFGLPSQSGVLSLNCEMRKLYVSTAQPYPSLRP
jgi:hypothetical protein